MIRVLLTDDHPVVRTGYRRLLEQAGDIEVVAEAGDGDAACAAFDRPANQQRAGVHAEDENARLGRALQDAANQLQPPAAGHR